MGHLRPGYWMGKTQVLTRLPDAQGAQYPLNEEYTLNHIKDLSIMWVLV